MRRTVTTLLLAAYAVAVVFVTMFPLNPHSDDYPDDLPWWANIHYTPGYVDAPSFAANIVMFLPFGVLVPLLWPAADGWRRMLVRGLLASAGIEAVQLVLDLTIGGKRTIDVNDLLSNAVGALLGLALLRLARPAPTPVRAD